MKKILQLQIYKDDPYRIFGKIFDLNLFGNVIKEMALKYIEKINYKMANSSIFIFLKEFYLKYDRKKI